MNGWVFGDVWDKEQHEQRDLIKGTEYFIRRDRHEVLAIKLKLYGVKRMIKKTEKGINQ